jgi:alpha-glucosidase (family GH31 glycosyl hydrolase)
MKTCNTGLILFLIAISSFAQTFTQIGNKVVSGKARFSILSQGLMRMEYSDSAKFLDGPTFMAINRSQQDQNFAAVKQGDTVVITTSKMVVRYRMTGAAFSTSNLVVNFTTDKRGSWHPGAASTQNLFSTLTRTMENWTYSGDPTKPGLLTQGILARDGWGLLEDNSASMTNDTAWSWWRARPSHLKQDWYLFAYGSDYLSALRDYGALSGTPPLPPRWSFGLWHSRWTSYSDKDIYNLVSQFDNNDIPIDVIMLDMDWHRKYWCSWDWNLSLFPNPAQFLDTMKNRHLHVGLNDHIPGQNGSTMDIKGESTWPKLSAALGSNFNGTFDMRDIKYATAYMDILHEPIEQQGVGFWWIDGWNAPIPGINDQAWSNYVFISHMARTTPTMRPMILSRNGATPGSQRFPFHHSGDTQTGWGILKSQVFFTIRGANMLNAYWSSDIGGFWSGMTEELYARWFQFGALSPSTRIHSSGLDKRPWVFPAQTCSAIRDIVKIRYRLLPYIYSSCSQCTNQALPLCRPLYFSWPNSNESYSYDCEYTFGDNLLVAPVVAAGGSVAMWFPPGQWVNYFTGNVVNGPAKQTVNVPYNQIPLYAKAGSIIPEQQVSRRSDERPLDTLILRTYPGPASSFSLYEDDGSTEAYRNGSFSLTTLSQSYSGNNLHVSISAASGQFTGKLQNRTYEIVVGTITTAPSGVAGDGTALNQQPSFAAMRAAGQGYFYDASAKVLYVDITGSTGNAHDILVQNLVTQVPVHVANAGALAKLQSVKLKMAGNGIMMRYMLKKASPISLDLFDEQGRLLMHRTIDGLAGMHSAIIIPTMNHKQPAAGARIYRVRVGNEQVTGKLIHTRL